MSFQQQLQEMEKELLIERQRQISRKALRDATTGLGKYLKGSKSSHGNEFQTARGSNTSNVARAGFKNLLDILDLVPSFVSPFLSTIHLGALGRTSRACYIAVDTPLVWQLKLEGDFSILCGKITELHRDWSIQVYHNDRKIQQQEEVAINPGASPNASHGSPLRLQALTTPPIRRNGARDIQGSQSAVRNLFGRMGGSQSPGQIADTVDDIGSMREGGTASQSPAPRLTVFSNAGVSEGSAPPTAGGGTTPHHTLPTTFRSSPSMSRPTAQEVSQLDFDDWMEPYPWKNLYAYIYKGRVSNWRKHVSTQRIMFQACKGRRDFPGALRYLTKCVDWQWQGGLLGGLEALVNDLGKDLMERGHLYHSAFPLEEYEEPALADFAIAHLIAPQLHTGLTKTVTQGILCNPQSTGLQQLHKEIQSPDFNFERSYDKVLLTGTPSDRAAFLLQVSYFLGDSYETRLHQYLLCDLIRVWPERLIIDARRLSRTSCQHSICQAWLSFDRRLHEDATKYAKKALDMLPVDLRELIEGKELPNPIKPKNVEPIDRSLLSPEHQEQVPEMSFAFFTMAFISSTMNGAVTNYAYHLRCAPMPGRLAVASNNLGSLYYQRDDYYTSLDWLDHSKANNPRYWMTYKNTSKCYFKINNRQEALLQLNIAAAKCKPVPAELYSERSKLVDRPFADLEKATELCPRLSYPYRYRSNVLLDNRKQEAAMAELGKIISITLDHQDIALRADFRREHQPAQAVDDVVLACTLVQNPAAVVPYRKWAYSFVTTKARKIRDALSPMEGPFGRASREQDTKEDLPPVAPRVGLMNYPIALALSALDVTDDPTGEEQEKDEATAKMVELLGKEIKTAVSIFYKKAVAPRVASPLYASAHFDRVANTGQGQLSAIDTPFTKQESMVLANELIRELEEKASPSPMRPALPDKVGGGGASSEDSTPSQDQSSSEAEEDGVARQLALMETSRRAVAEGTSDAEVDGTGVDRSGDSSSGPSILAHPLSGSFRRAWSPNSSRRGSSQQLRGISSAQPELPLLNFWASHVPALYRKNAECEAWLRRIRDQRLSAGEGQVEGHADTNPGDHNLTTRSEEVELVMATAGVNRMTALVAIEVNKGDIVDAIMQLTMDRRHKEEGSK